MNKETRKQAGVGCGLSPAERYKQTKFLLKLLVCSIITGVFLPPQTILAAPQIQSLDTIKDSAYKKVKAHFQDDPREIEINVGSIDRRLRLAACTQALEAFVPPGNRRQHITSVGIRCKGEKPWSVFVPIKVRIFESVIVAKRRLARGTLVRASDITEAKLDVSAIRGSYITNTEDVIGMELSRALATRMPFSSGSLKQPTLVRRGQKVNITVSLSSLSVTVSGRALMDGARGDVIRVMNAKTERVLEGRVTSENTVEIHI